jgi:exodeoxyribonuclease V gamma subunit
LQPLQAFSRQYFETGAVFRTFADDWRRMHVKTSAAAPLAPAPHIVLPHTITGTELLQLMRQPVEVFFRHRLQVRFEASVQAEPDDEPFALDGLEIFLAGQELLAELDTEAAQLKLRLSGTLPLGAFGERYTLQLAAHLSGLRERIEHWKARFPELLSPLPVALNIGNTHLTGALTDLRCLPVLDGAVQGSGPTQWLQLQSRPGAVYQGKDDKLQPRGDVMSMLWVQHLLACASAPESVEIFTVLLGADGEVQLRPLCADDALQVLGKLVAAYLEAWSRPLPVARKTAWALLQAASDDGLDHAQQAFSGVAGRPGERDASPYLQRAFASFDDMADELPHWAGQLYGDLAAHLGTRP